MSDISKHIYSTKFDAHMHIDWVTNVSEFASKLESLDVTVFGCTCLPQNYKTYPSPNILSALGAHPWHVKDCNMEIFFEHAKNTHYIGEIGFDSLKPDINRQIEIFKQVCSTIHPDSVLSIHAVKTKGMCLDILESSGLTKTCQIIFHSFADDADTLLKSIKIGCYFSVGERMLATKRGREYIKQIPHKRILFETDRPSIESDLSAKEILRQLQSVSKQVSEIKKYSKN